MGDVVDGGDGDQYTLYPTTSFFVWPKEPLHAKHGYAEGRLACLQVKYGEVGMRTSVAGVLLVHQHNFPYLLLLKINSTFFNLPGGRLKSGEDEIEGLRRKLSRKLCYNSLEIQTNWQIGKCIGMWWRPNFENEMYPYCPAHITKPKECTKLFLVHLSEGIHFAVPSNFSLQFVPFHEVYGNPQKYGPIIASIPIMLSRCQFNFSIRA